MVKTTRKRTTTKPANIEVIHEAKKDQSYINSYAKTNAWLEGTIAQVDQLSADVKNDLDAIRSSKTMKSKYTYITNLASSSAALINTKVQAIKEINSTISQSNKLELDRMKINRESELAKSDDARMMDLYKAFVNTPIGTYVSPNMGPPVFSDAMNPSMSGISPVTIDGDIENSSLSPEQMRMRMENNPNIIEVVKFDQSTGQRYFDVIDRTTGQSIPNYPRPADFLLDNTAIDIRTKTARNKNMDKVWPLILIGSGSTGDY